ncbi:hypothetical protein OCV69_13900, partial [Alitiscatomonas aceti]|nr:hypothetical protein [Alitiscatomonas aceti]
MRLRHIKGAEEQIAESPYVIQDPQGLKGKWHEFFGNQNPVFRRSTRKVPSFSSRHFFISFPASRFFLYLQQIFNALLGLF